MSELRVLVVDDSALFRQSLTKVLSEIGGVTVVGFAKDGREAIDKIRTLRPDLITLDVEMPHLNGIETLREMKLQKLKTPAIMLSSLTEAGAKVTLDALFEGAFDFIQKPTGGLVQSRDTLRAALSEKLNAFRTRHRGGTMREDAPKGPEPSFITPANDNTPRCDVVLIGLSTGGPQTLRHVLPRIDATCPVPIIIVQHMPEKYTRTMADRLDEVCPLSVCEATDGQRIVSGQIYVAPGGHHLTLKRQAGAVLVQTNLLPPENSCRPSVDHTLRSVVEVYRSHVLAVILTGMGRDGMLGCQLVHQTGGVVFAQDEETSPVFGMPKAVIDTGVVTRVLPLGKVAPAINRHVARHCLASTER